MSTILAIFKWIFEGLKKVLEFIIGLPGVIAGFVAGVVSAITSLWSTISSHIDTVTDFFNIVSSNVFNFLQSNSILTEGGYFDIFAYVIDLRTLVEVVFFLAGIVITVISSCVFSFIIITVTFLVVPFTYLALSKLVRLIVASIK